MPRNVSLLGLGAVLDHSQINELISREVFPINKICNNIHIHVFVVRKSFYIVSFSAFCRVLLLEYFASQSTTKFQRKSLTLIIIVGIMWFLIPGLSSLFLSAGTYRLVIYVEGCHYACDWKHKTILSNYSKRYKDANWTFCLFKSY